MALASLRKIAPWQWGVLLAFLASCAFAVYAVMGVFSKDAALTEEAMQQGSYTQVILATGEVIGKPKEAPAPEVTPAATTPKETKAAPPAPASHDAPAPAPVAPDAAPVPTAHEAAPNAEQPAPPAPETTAAPAAPSEPATAAPATPVAATPEAPATPPAAEQPASPMVAVTVDPSAQEVAPPQAGQPLQIKPNPALEEAYNGKVIPKRSEEGLLPCEYYARPDTTPRDMPVVALLVSGLGLNVELAKMAVAELPSQVSISFTPYAPDLQQAITMANRYGHEAWLDVPMEFADYPASDPGPLGLLKKATEIENLQRLKDTMATAKGYVGLVAPKDEIFTGYKMMEMMHHEVASRGLLMLLRSRAYKAEADAGSILYSSRALARDRTQEETAQSLKELEMIARDYGFAVGVIDPSPVNLQTVATWAKELGSRNIALIPLSAIPSRHR